MTTADETWTVRAEGVARATLARHADDVDRRGRWPAESVAALAEMGLLGLIHGPGDGVWFMGWG